MKRIAELAPLAPVLLVIIMLAGFLAACASAPSTPPQTVIKEVPVPYHQPCPKAADKPAVPKRVAEENPVMPTDPSLRERLLAAKVLELFGYADRADGILTACSKP